MGGGNALAVEPARVDLGRLGLLSETAGLDPAAMYLARLSKGSRATQSSALVQICRWLGGENPSTFGWGHVRYEHSRTVFAFARAELIAGTGAPRKPRTVNRYLAALRGVLKEAWRLGLMETDSYMRASDIRDLTDESPPTGRELSTDETDALLAACERDATPYGVRDLALLTLLGYGLRRSEVVGARLGMFKTTTGELTILGKGKKLRTIFINERHMKVIARWFEIRPAGDFIISSPHNGSAPLSTQTVYDVLKRRAQQAELKLRFSAHDFRRTFISRQLERTGDLATTQKLVGHSDPKTTIKYDRRDVKTLRKATEDLR